MTKYTIIGSNWKREVEIDESLFDKYSECCMEAATKVIEKWSEFKKHDQCNKHLKVSDIIMCHKSESNNFEFLRTKEVLINAGYYETAQLFGS